MSTPAFTTTSSAPYSGLGTKERLKVLSGDTDGHVASGPDDISYALQQIKLWDQSDAPDAKNKANAIRRLTQISNEDFANACVRLSTNPELAATFGRSVESAINLAELTREMLVFKRQEAVILGEATPEQLLPNLYKPKKKFQFA